MLVSDLGLDSASPQDDPYPTAAIAHALRKGAIIGRRLLRSSMILK